MSSCMDKDNIVPAEPTSEPTLSPEELCATKTTGSECRATPMCTYGKKGPCDIFVWSCNSLTGRRECDNTYGCNYANGVCSEVEVVDV